MVVEGTQVAAMATRKLDAVSAKVDGHENHMGAGDEHEVPAKVLARPAAAKPGRKPKSTATWKVAKAKVVAAAVKGAKAKVAHAAGKGKAATATADA